MPNDKGLLPKCDFLEKEYQSVIPAKAGIQEFIEFKRTGFPIKTFGNDIFYLGNRPTKLDISALDILLEIGI